MCDGCNHNKRVAKNISYLEFLVGDDCVSSNKLRIANFQRNYVWTRKHIVSLITSINETSAEDSLYLGNLVIQRSREGNVGQDLVVDGQQRLITLSLIVNCISVITNNIDCAKILLNQENLNTRIQFSRNKTNEIYKDIIKNKDLNKSVEDQVEKNFSKNYLLIFKEVKKIENLDIFFEKVKKIEFVVIKCPNSHDVNQLFESLNSKGKKLSPIELSKNSILLNAKVEEDLPKQINEKWEKIESLFEDKNSKIVWFEKFFRHRWFYIGGYVSNNNLFDSIKKYIKLNNVRLFTEELYTDSRIYLNLRKGVIEDDAIPNQSESPQTRELFLTLNFFKKMNIEQVYSVLLALVKYGKKDESYFLDVFFRDVENLWKFFVLVKFSKRFNPNSYEKKFASFCYKIHHLSIEKGETFKDTRNLFFKELFKLVPEEDEFISVINNKIRCIDIENKSNNFNISIPIHEDRDFIRSILLLFISSGDRMESSKKETIEHIIPKGNLSKWKNIKEKNKVQIEKVVRYKLGNLTILEKRLNSNEEVGNETFDVKYKKAYEPSIYSLNKNLLSYKNLFNSENPEDAVVERGKEIAKIIYNILKKYKKYD